MEMSKMLCVRAHGDVNEYLEHLNEHRPGAWIVVKTRYSFLRSGFTTEWLVEAYGVPILCIETSCV